jgi:hypothetical protein
LCFVVSFWFLLDWQVSCIDVFLCIFFYFC